MKKKRIYFREGFLAVCFHMKTLFYEKRILIPFFDCDNFPAEAQLSKNRSDPQVMGRGGGGGQKKNKD